MTYPCERLYHIPQKCFSVTGRGRIGWQDSSAQECRRGPGKVQQSSHLQVPRPAVVVVFLTSLASSLYQTWSIGEAGEVRIV